MQSDTSNYLAFLQLPHCLDFEFSAVALALGIARLGFGLGFIHGTPPSSIVYFFGCPENPG